MSQVFVEEVRKSMTQAETLFGVNLNSVVVNVNIKGYRTAGQAGWSRKGGIERFYLRFHPLAVSKYYEEMVNIVIPHEVAHMVCYKDPSRGQNHNLGWKRVCRMLGGNGVRTHNMDLDEARLGRSGKPSKKFLYRCANGETVELGLGRHRSLRSGKVCSYHAVGKGRILVSDFIRQTV